MSEKTTWDKVRNWVFGGGGAVALLLFMGFVDWRVDVKVDEAVKAALAATDIATDDKIISMDDEIDENGAKAEANTTRIDGNERRVELAFKALMGRSESSE